MLGHVFLFRGPSARNLLPALTCTRTIASECLPDVASTDSRCLAGIWTDRKPQHRGRKLTSTLILNPTTRTVQFTHFIITHVRLLINYEARDDMNELIIFHQNNGIVCVCKFSLLNDGY